MINKWLIEFFVGICNTMLGGFVAFINMISTTDILGSSFKNLLGETSGNGTSVYTLAKALHDIGVVPIAHSILALVMLVQIIKISQKMDASATIPTLKEILTIAVFFTIFSYLINNSVTLCEAIFTEAGNLTQLMREWTGMGNGLVLGNISVSANDVADPSMVINTLILCIVAWIMSLIAYLVALVTTYARAFQLYVMMAFSPIPLALLGFDETRSSGVNFIRSFVALCLSFTILMFTLFCFPYVVAGLVSDVAGGGVIEVISNMTSGSTSIALLKLLAICLVLIFAIVKSGSFAKEIMGG